MKPAEFLSFTIRKEVVVALNSGDLYQGNRFVNVEGTLHCLDGFMNITLEDVRRWNQKSSCFSEIIEKIAFIRGNNGNFQNCFS